MGFIWFCVLVYCIVKVVKDLKQSDILTMEMRYYGPKKYNELKESGQPTRIKLTPDSECNHFIANGTTEQRQYYLWVRDVYNPMARKTYGDMK